MADLYDDLDDFELVKPKLEVTERVSPEVDPNLMEKSCFEELRDKPDKGVDFDDEDDTEMMKEKAENGNEDLLDGLVSRDLASMVREKREKEEALAAAAAASKVADAVDGPIALQNGDELELEQEMLRELREARKKQAKEARRFKQQRRREMGISNNDPKNQPAGTISGPIQPVDMNPTYIVVNVEPRKPEKKEKKTDPDGMEVDGSDDDDEDDDDDDDDDDVLSNALKEREEVPRTVKILQLNRANLSNPNNPLYNPELAKKKKFKGISTSDPIYPFNLFPDHEESRALYISMLPIEWNEYQLLTLLREKAISEPLSLYLKRNARGISRRTAYLLFKEKSETLKAVTTLNGLVLDANEPLVSRFTKEFDIRENPFVVMRKMLEQQKNEDLTEAQLARKRRNAAKSRERKRQKLGLMKSYWPMGNDAQPGTFVRPPMLLKEDCSYEEKATLFPKPGTVGVSKPSPFAAARNGGGFEPAGGYSGRSSLNNSPLPSSSPSLSQSASPAFFPSPIPPTKTLHVKRVHQPSSLYNTSGATETSPSVGSGTGATGGGGVTAHPLLSSTSSTLKSPNSYSTGPAGLGRGGLLTSPPVRTSVSSNVSSLNVSSYGTSPMHLSSMNSRPHGSLSINTSSNGTFSYGAASASPYGASPRNAVVSPVTATLPFGGSPLLPYPVKRSVQMGGSTLPSTSSTTSAGLSRPTSLSSSIFGSKTTSSKSILSSAYGSSRK